MSDSKSSKRSPIIALDFDGTIVTHEYPRIGDDIGAVPYLLMAQDRWDVRFLLLTMRDGDELSQAARWLLYRGVRLWAVNENPEQQRWTESQKVYANLYIDDAALGVPLSSPTNTRPWVDWDGVYTSGSGAGDLLHQWLQDWYCE